MLNQSLVPRLSPEIKILSILPKNCWKIEIELLLQCAISRAYILSNILSNILSMIVDVVQQLFTLLHVVKYIMFFKHCVSKYLFKVCRKGGTQYTKIELRSKNLRWDTQMGSLQEFLLLNSLYSMATFSLGKRNFHTRPDNYLSCFLYLQNFSYIYSHKKRTL